MAKATRGLLLFNCRRFRSAVVLLVGAVVLLPIAITYYGLYDPASPLLPDSLVGPLDRLFHPWEGRVGLATSPAPDSLDAGVVTGDEATAGDHWVYLSDLPWQYANTSWVAVGNERLPTLDKAFTGGPISIGGQVYDRGVGTYPLSEIEYRVDGEYAAFESNIGVDDSVPAGEGGVAFQVYFDDAMVYTSNSMKSGDPPLQIELSLQGIKSIRLVTIDATDGAVRNYANWANAKVLRRSESSPQAGASRLRAIVQRRNEEKKNERENDKRAMAAIARAETHEFQMGFSGRDPDAGVAVAQDERRGLLELANSKLGIELGYGGNRHGFLTVLDLEDGRLVLYNAAGSVALSGGQTIDLALDTVPVDGGFRFDEVEDPVFGPGKHLEADFRAMDESATVVVEITLFAEGRLFLYSLRLKDLLYPADEPPVFRYFTAADGSLVLGEDAEYLTDFSRVRRAYVRDDGVVHEEKISQGKPVFIWSNRMARGLILAALDETAAAPSVKLQQDAGRIVAKLGYSSVATPGGTDAPRLYVEVTDSVDMRQAFVNFRRFFATLYPPLAMPAWVKYQWLSWYPYGMEIGEDALREQIDYIADNLADLGPWHIIVDAGWYVAEGRPGAEWRHVDDDKFPNGLRALVDYAHARGVKVVLYFSTPYLDSREQTGDWLGLKWIIDNHPDWLLPIGEGDGRQSFVYDYANPDLRAYMEEVLEQYFVLYDVDGMKLDGLGNAEGAILDPSRIDAFGLVDRVVGQTLDIYRFNYAKASSLKEDVYVESGWLTPLFANQYAQTFRFGDETDSFESAYPYPGLVEHIDYAQMQKMVLGQRPNMGAARGDPNFSQINKWMLEAGLALGSQVVLSFYLPAMDDPTLSFYRSLLYHYDAFEGETHYGSSLYADTFATTVKGTTYLGVLNRGEENKTYRLRLADFGLPEGQGYTVYKVENGEYGRVRNFLDAFLPAKSFALFVLRAEPGVMWTDRSVEYSQTDSEITLNVRGPRSLPGFVQVLAPGFQTVLLDGVELKEQAEAEEGESTYEFNPRSRVVTVRYGDDGEHEIRIAIR